MPSKYDAISALAAHTAYGISDSPDAYMDFLKTAANNYKYSFDDQLLIYAQKPDATACADIQTWNRLGRWVNRGTKGIALLAPEGSVYKLRHVFDLSDTNSYARQNVNLWKMERRHEGALAESLQNSFGVVENSFDFADFLQKIAEQVAEDNYPDYLLELNDARPGSLLEELDDLNTAVWFKTMLKASVAYMLLTRCGYDADRFFGVEDFIHVFDFNTLETISILGAASSDISEMLLREVERTIRDTEKSRTFAKAKEPRHNERENDKNERSFDHGTDLPDAGRLSDPESDRAEEPEDREIWNVATDLSAETPERPLHGDASQREAERASGGDRPAGDRDAGAADGTAGESTGRDREPESLRPDDMGGADEQHPQLGGGDGDERADLPVIDDLPTVEEQQNILTEAEEDKASAFAISQEDIDAVLTRGSGIHEGKYRIYEQFLKKESKESNIAFLKNEYGVGGAYPAAPDRNIDESHDAKGIKISRGHISEPDSTILLKWNKVEKRIAELIEAGRYLSQAELDHYPAYRAETEARTARWAISKEFRSIVEDYNDFVEQLSEEEKKLNLYYLSACWGAFGVGDKKMHARVAEGDFILPMMREAMNTIIADNTHLTERCEAMLELLNSDIAKPFEPTYDELNPPPEPEKEYRFSLGDTVYLGTQEYEVLSFDESEVVLYDTQYPLFNKTLPREEFEKRLKENPLNDNLLHAVEDAGIEDDFSDVDPEAIRRSLEERGIVNGELVDPEALEADPFIQQVKADAEAAVHDEVEELVGKEILLDDRKFVVERYEPTGDEYSLRDVTFEENAGFPISRVEKASFVREHLHSPEAELAPPPAPAKRRKLTPHVLYPEIHSEYRTNFKIDRNDIGEGTPLERFYHNKSAIQLLKKLESEHRLAQPYEQNVLSEYVGWGGLSEFFQEENPHYTELKELLTEEEYASARESTLTAFYTPPVVIKAMYQALENMNFQTGNVLEPSCGIGNFMGLVPDSMSTAKLYGVELDSISGRIARQLYQNASIAVQGYEKTELPDSFFDAAVGNVPFGQFKVMDKKYDKYNFLIHDYFFARTLDKVRPGGIIAFITSKGTLDKENSNVRKYIAQRADLLGAIRLPNNTFKDAAGTEVTSDIIFLQKRDRLIDQPPDWVHLDTDENGVRMNSYFVQNPDMILGDMKMVSGPFGPESACIAYDGASLGDLLSDAIENIHAEYTRQEFEDELDTEAEEGIPADPDVRNFSYTLYDGKLYYRENSVMNPVDVSVTAANRIKGMIGIRDCVRELIEVQTEDYPDVEVRAKQEELNQLYDDFAAKYGRLNDRANKTAFLSDSSFCLLSALEVLDDEGNFVRKADMFTKRTIKQRVAITHVDTATEALAVSMAEKARVDMPYMMELTDKSEAEIAADLRGVIFLNPAHTSEEDGKPKYLPADEYLSGNVREKLALAKRSAEVYPDDYAPNVEALEAVQPVDLTASEISVRLGATWLPTEVIEDFMFELLETPRYQQWNIKAHYSAYTGEWNIEGKSRDSYNIKAYNTYGTDRINAYKIIEDTLNLRDVRIFDYVVEPDGKRTPVLNKKETAIAQGKQEAIKQAFEDWIWADPHRRDVLCRLYNEKFNSFRPREYDGSHLSLVGINPEIALRPHQLNAVARGLYGGNELLGHVVGAGKTFTMAAIAQESKRLGLCQKSLIVVPNHLTEQWAAEYLQLYPSANILVATKKDFETRNRKRFCGRIATGDYDAIIIGHSQLEKIPMSVERQQYILQQQLEEIMDGIMELKHNRGDKFSIKQLEKSKKTVQQKLEKLNDQSRKDDLVTFEELGVDRLFIDEAHYYKNLAAFTKMRNVGGISQTEAQKSSDLYMKCRYLDEITGGRGVVFATGTPISNSMVEMYTMQKYLQYGALKRNGLLNFDAWASTFGETVTAIELAPEGSGYRAKTRFAKFYNLPELMVMFKEVADIQTADMLNLPVPKANYHNVVLKPSEHQKEMVDSLSERAERVRNRMVDSSEDNMLVITNDGRKLALDQRLINPMLPDYDGSKCAACAENVFEIWQRTAAQRSTQMIFCDLSTPHGDGSFNVYDDIRDKLIAKGIPAEEIAYIHNAASEAKKKELFGKVRSGQIRVLLGSTQKMGAGTNVQQKLIALHHLDCPWRPSDLQQREGRIVRQGNENPEVDIFTYVTENTFDSYLYQLVESKQKFIGQIMTSKSPVRSAEDIDETALSYAEIKALCTGNPYIKEKMDLDIAVGRLKLLKANHLSQKYALEDKILKEFPQKISAAEQRVQGFKEDIEHLKQFTEPNEDGFSPMFLMGGVIREKREAGEAILGLCKSMTSPEPVHIGSYRGFDMELSFDSYTREYKITLRNQLSHYTALGTDIFGNIQRLDNVLDHMDERLQDCENLLEATRKQLESAKVEVEKPFAHEDELKAKTERLNELNALLNLDKPENEIVDGERGEDDAPEPQRKSEDRER